MHVHIHVPTHKLNQILLKEVFIKHYKNGRKNILTSHLLYFKFEDNTFSADNTKYAQ